MKNMKITIEYNPVDQSLSVTENDFTHIEAFGVLSAAIHSIGNHWTSNCELVMYEDDVDEDE